MKQKKMYPFFILTLLILSFIVTYDIKESNLHGFQKFAFADILSEEISPAKALPEEPLYSLKYDTVTESIEYETKIVYNENVYEGTKNVVQEGLEGTKKYVYKRLYEDTTLLSRELDRIEYTEPVEEIIEVGTKKREIATSRGGFRYSKELIMTATAYDLSYESTGKNPGDPYYGITASGTKARPGVVAVDPSVIPLGTKLYIASTDGSPDYGFATAEDTGGAIKGNRIDLFMEDNEDCYNFGIRPVKVYILN